MNDEDALRAIDAAYKQGLADGEKRREAMASALRTIKGLLIGAEMDGTQWLVLPKVPINVCAEIDMALGEIGPR